MRDDNLPHDYDQLSAEERLFAESFAPHADDREFCDKCEQERYDLTFGVCEECWAKEDTENAQ